VYRKKEAAGQAERRTWVERWWPGSGAVVDAVLAATRRADVQPDDVLDAFALAVSARRPLVSIPGEAHARAESGAAGAVPRAEGEAACAAAGQMVFPRGD
jgi:predicted RNase H-like nuclease